MKKIFLFLLICIVLSVPTLAAIANDEPEQQSSSLNINALNSRIITKNSFLPEYQDPILDKKDQPGIVMILFKIFFQLVFVLALIYLCILAIRRFMNNKTLNAPYHKMIKILESHYFSQKQALHLIDIGGKIMLIGANENTMTLLTEISDEDTKEAIISKTSVKSETGFNKYLNRFITDLDDSDDVKK